MLWGGVVGKAPPLDVRPPTIDVGVSPPNKSVFDGSEDGAVTDEVADGVGGSDGVLEDGGVGPTVAGEGTLAGPVLSPKAPGNTAAPTATAKTANTEPVAARRRLAARRFSTAVQIPSRWRGSNGAGSPGRCISRTRSCSKSS